MKSRRAKFNSHLSNLERYDSIKATDSNGNVYFGFMCGYMESYVKSSGGLVFTYVILYKGTNFKKSMTSEKTNIYAHNGYMVYNIGYPELRIIDSGTKVESCRMVIFEKCMFENDYLKF